MKRDRKTDLAAPRAFEQLAGDRTALLRSEPQRFDAHGRRPIRLDDERAPELLHHDEHVDRTAIEAALRFGNRQREQTEFGERAPMLFIDARLRRDDLLPRIERICLVEITAQRIAELLLFIAESKVHAPLLKVPESSAR